MCLTERNGTFPIQVKGLGRRLVCESGRPQVSLPLPIYPPHRPLSSDVNISGELFTLSKLVSEDSSVGKISLTLYQHTRV